jgi:hypothetical protein
MDEPTLRKYKVRLTRDTSESCDIEVEAKSWLEAEAQAYLKAGKYGELLDTWESDEGNMTEVYITACHPIETE